MSAESAADTRRTVDDAELVERDRWDAEVVNTGRTTIEWGTHAFEVRFQAFVDGSGHLEIGGAPTDPPPAAEEIVADALAGEWADPEVGLILARAWGLEPGEVRRNERGHAMNDTDADGEVNR